MSFFFFETEKLTEKRRTADVKVASSFEDGTDFLVDVQMPGGETKHRGLHKY